MSCRVPFKFESKNLLIPLTTDKAMKELGWQPTTMFKDGIKLTVQWHKDHMGWLAECTSGDYQKYYQDMYGKR